MFRSPSLRTALILALPFAAFEVQPIPEDAQPMSTDAQPILEYTQPIRDADFTLGTENARNRWSATIPPVLTVPSGAVVENTRGMVEPQYETGDCYAVTGFATTIDRGDAVHDRLSGGGAWAYAGGGLCAVLAGGGLEDLGDGGRAAHVGEHAYAEGGVRGVKSDWSRS